VRHLGVGPAEYRRRFQPSSLGSSWPPAKAGGGGGDVEIRRRSATAAAAGVSQ
jgi:hypothetical protein